MKKTSVFFIIVLLFSLVLASCPDSFDAGDTSTISININSGSTAGRAAVNVDKLVHIITLTGSSGEQTHTVYGAGFFKAVVVPGHWEIEVEAYLDGYLYAVGSTTVEVRAGRNAEAEIHMDTEWEGSDGNSGSRGSGRMPYAIGLSQNGTYDFAPVTIGYSTVPPPITVTIVNVGYKNTGDLTISLSGTNTGSFKLSSASTSIADLEPGGRDKFTIGPIGRLPAGTHAATVTVSGQKGINASFGVRFIVNVNYGISLSTGGHTFASKAVGYGTPGFQAAPTPLTVTVTNIGDEPTGTLAIGISGVPPEFTVSTTTISDIPLTGTDTFTVEPNSGLPAGTHTANITVSNANISESFFVIFDVNAPTFSVSTVPSSATFPESSGYTAGGTTITVTNTGNQPTGTLTVEFTGPAGIWTLSTSTMNSIDVDGSDTFNIGYNAGGYSGFSYAIEVNIYNSDRSIDETLEFWLVVS